MRAYRARSRSRAPGPSAVAACLVALAASAPPGVLGEAPPRQPRESPRAAAGDGIVALLGDQPVRWEHLAPAFAELAGSTVLEEFVLDRELEAELTARGLSVTPADTEAERAALVESLARDARADPNDAQRLIDQVRRSRGLGPARFAAQLARTAGLRKLVAGTVTISDVEVRAAHAMRHGPSFVTRVILVPDEREASRVWSDLKQGEGGLSARFADAAVRHSRDPSAPRGGLLGPVSPADPTYPAAVRRAIATQEPGALGDVLAVDNGFALVLVEERLPGDGTPIEQVEADLRAELTRRRERLAMDDAARRLLARARVAVVDDHLRWSWEGRAAR